MSPHIAVVEKESDSAFGLWFPDVPGCFSAADHEADNLNNALNALKLHLEDRELPEARPIDVIDSVPEVAQQLRDGAYLLAVSLIAS